MDSENKFAGLSKASLQDALLNRLSLLSNAKRQARQVRDEIFDLKQDLHQIYCELHGLKNVIPFKRVTEYLEAPAQARTRRRA